MATDRKRDTASDTHQRAPFNDPLRGGMDPTAPGAPHEPGGEASRQSERSEGTPITAAPDSEERGVSTDKD